MYTNALFTNPTTSYKEAFTYGSVTDQVENINVINTSYTDIANNLKKHVSLKEKIDKDEKYKDFRGNYLSYNETKKTVKDAVKEDIHAMILQQNNAYIVGMIAISVVLITTFLVTKK